MKLLIDIMAYGMQWAIETAFLLLALWVMVRIQKLQYKMIGLAISAGIACAFDLIPFVGHYIALAALWICLTKVTREDFTGVVFTAAISYALVFAMNLFVLSALMGDLRPSARARTVNEKEPLPVISSEDEADAVPPAPVHQHQKPSPVSKQPAEAPIVHKTSSFRPDKVFRLKGITENGKLSTAILSAGRKTHTVALGEAIVVDTSEGPKSVRLEKVENGSVLLDVAGESFRLVPMPP